MVVGAANAFTTGPWRAGAVGGIVVVGVGEGASGRPARVRIAAGRGRALVSRLHGGAFGGGRGGFRTAGGSAGYGRADIGEGRQPELELCGLGTGGSGEGVAARGQSRRDATGICVSTQARRL